MILRCPWSGPCRAVSVLVGLTAILPVSGLFAGKTTNHVRPNRAPELIHHVQPLYPPELRQIGRMGGVFVEFSINQEGAVVEARSVAETDPRFGEQAVRAVSQWRFAPAQIGDTVATASMSVPVYFSPDPSESKATTDTIVSMITGFPVQAPPQLPAAYRYDQGPHPEAMTHPVWPWIDGVPVRDGEAYINYGIDYFGDVVMTQRIAATNEDFGRAAQAAMEYWRFQPARLNGSPVPAVGRRKVHFNYYMPEDAPEMRHYRAVRNGTASYASAKELDERPRPIRSGLAKYPVSLVNEKPDGTAVIECIIDRTGRVCLPRIVEASREEFGWAAATAAAHWRFAPPKVKGEPVDVKMRIPFKFVGMEKPAE